jgi:non-specific serine/threonine protein kinase
MVLNQLALITRVLGRLAEAESYSDEAIAVGRQSGFVPQLGGALRIKGFIAFERGDFDTARAACHEVLASRDRQVPVNLAIALWVLGLVAFAEGEYVAADNWFEEAADTASAVSGSEDFVDGLTATALALGDYPRARHICEEALESIRDTGRKPTVEVYWLNLLADVALEEGDVDQAERLLRRGLELYDFSVFFPWFPAYLGVCAHIALARGDPERAALLLGAYDAMREQLGISVIPLEWPPRTRTIAAARTALSDDAFAAAWNTGRVMPYKQAVTYALGREPPRNSPDRPGNIEP